MGETGSKSQAGPDVLVASASRSVTCYAHRGARSHAPENTLLAFALAFGLGAQAIECDVQRSRDGQLVILHDGTVDRTTDGTGYVSEMSFRELRTLNAGRRWRTSAQIPTLEETLALVHEHQGALNLEVKGESVEQSVGTALAIEPVLHTLDDDFRRRILVSSFEHPAVLELKRRLPWLRVALLYGSEWKDRDLILPALAANAEAIHPATGLVTPDLIRHAHNAGLAVNVWTANRLATIRQLLAWSVDGLFSDYPERVIKLRTMMPA